MFTIILLWCLIGVAISMLTAYLKPEFYLVTLFMYPIGWVALAIMSYISYKHFTD